MRALLRGLLALPLVVAGVINSAGCSKDDPDDPQWKNKAPEVPPVSSKEAGKKVLEKK